MKKANESMQGFIVTAIIIIAVLIFVLMFYNRIFQITEETADVEVCRQSILTHGAVTQARIMTFDDIKCPMTNLTITSGDEEEIKEQIAIEMAESWYKFGEGEWEIFELERGTNKYCVVSTVIEFEGLAKEKTINDLPLWLAEHDVPLRYITTSDEDFGPITPMTYTEYLTGYASSPDEIKEALEETPNNISTNHDYAVMFLYAKKGYLQKIPAAGIGAGAGAAAGIAITLILIPDPITSVAGAAMLGAVLITGGAAAGGAAGYEAGSERYADWEAGVLLWPFNTESLKQLDCDLLPVGQD